mmetsp:Transcript_35319/g.77197  ORF Transcript_35319/g.77197 Transcript_35319/m.77197 type:complete len:242 (-) Transcript_35319:84-809(-)
MRYRLYRSVVAGATGRVGEALTRQLLLSPLCSEVNTVGRSKVRSFDNLAAAKEKLRQHDACLSRPLCDVDPKELEGVDVAFCVLGSRKGWAKSEEVAAVERDGAIAFAKLCDAAGVQHISLLSSAWAAKDSRLPFARLQAEAVDAYEEMSSFKRVSIFQPSAAVDEEGRTFQRPDAPLWARMLWSGVPLWTQFLPTRYRQASLNDIVLAMRLNAELCDATERVEKLDFKDMMMIIGRENDV